MSASTSHHSSSPCICCIPMHTTRSTVSHFLITNRPGPLLGKKASQCVHEIHRARGAPAKTRYSGHQNSRLKRVWSDIRLPEGFAYCMRRQRAQQGGGCCVGIEWLSVSSMWAICRTLHSIADHPLGAYRGWRAGFVFFNRKKMDAPSDCWGP